MNAVLNVPVNGRDWGVYRAVRVEKRTTREVATEFGISQTRVCQIAERVGKFVLEVTPEATEEQLGKQFNMAQQIASEQVQHFLRRAVESYDASRGEQRTVRISDGEQKKTVTTIRQCHGEVRYLDLACRLALLGAKLPVSMLSQQVDWEAEERDAVSEAREEEQAASELASPANEDCSTLAAEQGDGERTAAASDAVSAAIASLCESRRTPIASVRIANDAPVQTATEASSGDKKLNAKQRVLRKVFFASAG